MMTKWQRGTVGVVGTALTMAVTFGGAGSAVLLAQAEERSATADRHVDATPGMRRNKVRQRIANGEPAVGIGLLYGSPDLVEFLGYLGFDWVWFDGEHGHFSPDRLWDLARAAELSGMAPVIRAPSNDPALLLSYVEAGMMGVIVPHVTSAADIVAAVNAVKFPPEGHRSSSASRPAKYALHEHRRDYFRRANRETMVIALVEEPEGLENLADILTVKGLDAVVIGYGDLSLSLGHPGEKDHPEVKALTHDARAMIVESGVWLQETIQSPEEARRAVETGAKLVRGSLNDQLARVAREYMRTVRGLNEP